MRFFSAIALIIASAEALKIKQRVVSENGPAWDDIIKMIDTDGSGTLSLDEVKNFVIKSCTSHGGSATDCQSYVDQAEGLFKAIDKDGSGEVDKAEFEAFVKSHETSGTGGTEGPTTE